MRDTLGKEVWGTYRRIRLTVPGKKGPNKDSIFHQTLPREEGVLFLAREREPQFILLLQFNASVSDRRSEPEEGSQVIRRAPEVQHRGIPATPDSKEALSGAQLKCLYANAHSMGSKQEELERYTNLQIYAWGWVRN